MLFPFISAVLLLPRLFSMSCHVAPPTGHREGDRLLQLSVREEKLKGLTEAAAVSPAAGRKPALKAQNKAEEFTVAITERSARILVPSCGTRKESAVHTQERTQHSLSDSVFVHAWLNYLPVCLKAAQGNLDISSSQPALKSLWPIKAWRPFMKCSLYTHSKWGVIRTELRRKFW